MKKYHTESDWNYYPTEQMKKNFFGSREDWRQTISTKINECATFLHMAYPDGKGRPKSIRCHYSLKFILMDCEYFHPQTNMLSGFLVCFTCGIEEDTIEISLYDKISKITVIT